MPFAREELELVQRARPPMSGTKSSHTPDDPSRRMGSSRPSHCRTPRPRSRCARSAPTPRTRRRARRRSRAGARRASSRAAVRALVEEMQIDVAERGQEAIRIAALPRRAVGEVKAQAIAQRQRRIGDERAEQSALEAIELHALPSASSASARTASGCSARTMTPLASRYASRRARRGCSAGRRDRRRGGGRSRSTSSPASAAGADVAVGSVMAFPADSGAARARTARA